MPAGMVNDTESDQTDIEAGLIRVYTVCSGLSVQKIRKS